MIYAIVTEQSIGKLFLAAPSPGLLATLGYAAANGVYFRLDSEAGPVVPAVPLGERVRGPGALPPVAAIFLRVIGGIYLGVFTPTEGAAIGATATAALAMLSGRLSWASFVSSVLETAQATEALEYPRSRTRRFTGNVMAAAMSGEEVEATASVAVWRFRAGETAPYVGRYDVRPRRVNGQLRLCYKRAVLDLEALSDHGALSIIF